MQPAYPCSGSDSTVDPPDLRGFAIAGWAGGTGSVVAAGVTADLHVEVGELPESERCNKRVERNKNRERDHRVPRPHTCGENDHHDREANLEGNHQRCADHWGHDRVDLDRTEVEDEDVRGNGVENVQCEKGKSENNRDSAESRKLMVVDATAGCQLPQTHSGCLPSMPRGAARRLRRPYRLDSATARAPTATCSNPQPFVSDGFYVPHSRFCFGRMCMCPQGRLRVGRGGYPIPLSAALRHDGHIRYILKGDDHR